MVGTIVAGLKRRRRGKLMHAFRARYPAKIERFLPAQNKASRKWLAHAYIPLPRSSTL